MPRTKAVKKNVLQETTRDDVSSTTDNTLQAKDMNSILKQIDSIANDRILDSTRRANMNISKIEETIKNIKIRLGESALNMTVSEFMKNNQSEVSTKRLNKENSTLTSTKKFDWENLTVGSKGKGYNAPISSNKFKHITPSSSNKFRTPVNRLIPALPMVTPKVNPNIPMSVLRRPHQGEFALSLSGSPLLVSGITYDMMASVSVPLPDGRVISILPTEGIEGADMRLDKETRLQLQMLRKNLTKCLQK